MTSRTVSPGVSTITLRAALVVVLALGILAAPHAVEAQQAGKVYRVGLLGFTPGPTASIDNLLHALRDLGYIEGRNLVMEFRWAAGKTDRLPDLADDLVRAKVDVIVTYTTQGVRAAKRATETIPIVFSAGNPERLGVVASLARPGGNATGVALQVVGASKAVQLLKDAVPKISRLVRIYDPRSALGAGVDAFERHREVTAAELKPLGVTLQWIPLSDPDDAERIFSRLVGPAEGLILDNAPGVSLAAPRICGIARERKLPALGASPRFADAGCLMGYGEHMADVPRRLAVFVDKILKGAKPADLPVEQPTKFELVINLKTAKALGLTIPPSVLLRADRVIE